MSSTNNQDTNGTSGEVTPSPSNNNRRNNNNNRRNNRRNGGTSQQGQNTSTFKGSITKMNGHIFTLKMDSNPKHEYNRTLKELQGYVAQECESPNLFMSLFSKDPVSPTVTAPTAPDDVSTSKIIRDFSLLRAIHHAIG